MESDATLKQLEDLKRKIRKYRIAFVCALAACAAGILLGHYRGPALSLKSPTHRTAKTLPPHYETVMHIIGPLRYSGLYSLMKPSVTVTVDFDKQLWYIHNMHRFDARGNVILDNDRYGLCGELAAYVFEKIRPSFEKYYLLKFMRVSESGFFLTPQSTHVVLMVTDTRSPDDHTYIIDPSFEKYENMNDLDDYWFFETSDALAFKEAKETDVFFSIDHGTPVFIKKDFLVTLTVEKVDNKCDRKNFALTLQATRRYKYSGRYLFALRIHEGKLEKFENEFLAKQVLGDNETEYVELRSQMLRWFEGIYRDSQK